ncbi:hypothetical protein LCGC14_2663970 [marine sediment metagenome]|uniref:Uncharacterized protein n=1 Tax=marine sediment metagenome TaxID=412755 RepID=A0A0F8ZR14_9ZZZZ
MKIQLINDVPVDSKYGMTKGRVFEVIKEGPRTKEADEGVWVLGDEGTEVKIFTFEYDVINPPNKQ